MNKILSYTHKYDDIIDLPHHVSEKHPQMSNYDRAAQFSPFSALTGYGEAVEEAARLTEGMVLLDESEKDILDSKFSRIREHLYEKPKVTVSYFKPDEKKEGGSYEKVSGMLLKIDEKNRKILLEGDIEIEACYILDIEPEGGFGDI